MAGHREKSNDSVERNLALSYAWRAQVSSQTAGVPQSRDCAPHSFRYLSLPGHRCLMTPAIKDEALRAASAHPILLLEGPRGLPTLSNP